MFDYRLPIFIGIVILFAAQIIMLKKKVRPQQNLLVTLLIVYLTALVSVTFFPIVYQTDAVEMRYGYEMNFVPFKGIISALNDSFGAALRNVGGNFILLMPLGFLIPLISRRKNRFSVTLISGICVAAGIELLQYIIGCIIGYMYRAVDIDDFILNFVGCLFGFAVFMLLKKPLFKIFKIKK